MTRSLHGNGLGLVALSLPWILSLAPSNARTQPPPMSVDLYVVLPSLPLPTLSQWQAGITNADPLLRLAPNADLTSARGAVTCHLGTRVATFELYVDPPRALKGTYARLDTLAATAAAVATFSWGGSAIDGACAMGAAAGLVDASHGSAYDPQADSVLSAKDLRAEAAALLPHSH